MSAPSEHIFKIAIDGHSSCGKSTLAKDLARILDFLYVDSGAMYRAVSLYFIDHHINLNEPVQISKALEQIQIDFIKAGEKYSTLLNGRDVEERIREQDVADIVSDVARIPEVRQKMVAIQRAIGAEHSIVMDGRDIGTVVFPDADLKIFLTAGLEIRTQRRYAELTLKGMHPNIEEVRENLQKRDLIDSTRLHSPLKKADDAIVIDNSRLNRNDQLSLALDLVKQKQKAKKKGG